MASVLKEITLLKGTYEFKERETLAIQKEISATHDHPDGADCAERTWTFMKEMKGNSTVEPFLYSFCTHSNGFTASSTTTSNFSIY